jgi:hypothetical protein
MQIDHVWPRSRGGADADYNLIAACKWCNNEKSDKIPFVEWIPAGMRLDAVVPLIRRISDLEKHVATLESAIIEQGRLMDAKMLQRINNLEKSEAVLREQLACKEEQLREHRRLRDVADLEAIRLRGAMLELVRASNSAPPMPSTECQRRSSFGSWWERFTAYFRPYLTGLEAK